MSNNKDQYYIRFDFPKEGINYQNYLAAIENVLNGFYTFNNEVIKSFNISIDTELYIVGIEKGSLLIKLKDKIKKKLLNTTDEEIDNFVDKPVKTIISCCLKKARNIMINRINKCELENDTNVIDTTFIEVLGKDIENCIKENKSLQSDLFIYEVDKQKIQNSLELISAGTYELDNKVYYNDGNKINKATEIEIKGKFMFKQDKITTLTEENSKISDSIIITKEIYKILNSSFKENIKWKFMDEDKEISCEIFDEIFLNKVKHREIAIMYGDLYRVEVETKTFIIVENSEQKTKKERRILKVLEIIEPKLLT